MFRANRQKDVSMMNLEIVKKSLHYQLDVSTLERNMMSKIVIHNPHLFIH